MEKVLAAITQAILTPSAAGTELPGVYAVIYLNLDRESRELLDQMGPQGTVGHGYSERKKYQREMLQRIAKRMWKRAYPVGRLLQKAPLYRAWRGPRPRDGARGV